MKNKKKTAEVSRVVNGVIEEYRKGSPATDPFGMYTGISKISENSVSRGHYTAGAGQKDPDPEQERPTQDADDL